MEELDDGEGETLVVCHGDGGSDLCVLTDPAENSNNNQSISLPTKLLNSYHLGYCCCDMAEMGRSHNPTVVSLR